MTHGRDMSHLPVLRWDRPDIPSADDVVNAHLPTLLSTRLLVQASSGGGKSWMLRTLLEQTFGRVQHLVIDPEGEFATLRERFPYVVAGREGDLVLSATIAKRLCRRLMEREASAILDLSDLAWPDRREVVRLVVTELMALPRTLWRNLLVVVDEAHAFAPEQGRGQATSLDPLVALASAGRKRGYCAVFATQRLSKLHKDVADVGNKLIGRTFQDVDVKRAGDELGFDQQKRRTLPLLIPGSFYAMGPAFGGVQLVRSSEVVTTHPEAGAVRAAPPMNPDVDAIVAGLGDLPQEVKAELDEMARLGEELQAARAEIQRLTTRPAAAPTVDVEAIVRRARDEMQRRFDHVRDEQRQRITDVVAEVHKQLDRLDVLPYRLAEPVEASGPSPRLAVETTPGVLPTSVRSARSEVGFRDQFLASPTAPVQRSASVVVLDDPVRAPVVRAPSQREVPRLQAKILDTIAGFAALGVPQPDSDVVAAMCEYHPRAKSYVNAKGALRSAGLIDYPSNGTIALTAHGAGIARAEFQVQTRAELHALWCQKLGGVAAKILRPLLDAYPGPCRSDEVALAAGYHGRAKSFVNARGRLRSLGLIAYPRPGEIVATRLLFPDGLR